MSRRDVVQKQLKIALAALRDIAGADPSGLTLMRMSCCQAYDVIAHEALAKIEKLNEASGQLPLG